MIVVTGGAGFIGSNLVKALNQQGREDIIVVDNLTNGEKFRNIADAVIYDYLDKNEFLKKVESGAGIKGITRIFHQGACSDTTEQDGRYMMENNYSYSKSLLHYSLDNKLPFIYASSAAVYGGADSFSEEVDCERPINVYAYSKLLFDNYVRQLAGTATTQIVGLRYFNVYGPNEAHKRHMASVAFHVYQQLCQGNKAKLFEGSAGFGDGEQERDFVYVDDVVAVNLWFMENSNCSGIFNTGTGRSRSFNDVANSVISAFGSGEIEYIKFPDKLLGKYQSYTEADLQKLKDIGCLLDYQSLEAGTEMYTNWLKKVQPIA